MTKDEYRQIVREEIAAAMPRIRAEIVAAQEDISVTHFGRPIEVKIRADDARLRSYVSR